MNFIIDNFFVIVAGAAVGWLIGGAIYKFYNKPTKEQIATVKEWLLYAVIEAEKKFGSGTGPLQLRFVYDMFISKFNWLSKVISFEKFSAMVDEALDTLKETLEEKPSIQEYIDKEEK